MKLTQHGENLWQITRLHVINCYLVREDDGLTVVDTGMAGTEKDILAAAEAIGAPIKRITLTHAHGDHAGSLDGLAAHLPAAEIALAARTEAFLQGKLDLLPDEPQAKLRGSFNVCSGRASRIIAPQQHVGSLRVVAAPGHTPDQIAFYDERDGTLLAGDAFQTQGGVAVAGVIQWRFPLPGLATWHPPTALQTALALRALNPTHLAVGHGRVLETPAAQMEKAIDAAKAQGHGQTQMA